MKIKIPVTLTFALFALSVISAETVIPGGNVTGTWYKANSPYNITGNITIPVNNSLIIEPGVQVNFQGLYSLTVNGLLEAVGTETDSIHFFPADIGVSWWGILFENAPDSSHLAYCTVRYTGTFIFGYGGIRCINSNPVITHCRISNNYIRTASTYAGAIALNNSNAKISWCNISNNYSGNYGGGIYIYNSNPVITGCNISGNEVIQYGGGICILGNSSPIITKCTIENNTSNIYGGGIFASGSVVTISECTVGYNHAETGGGGISIHSGSVFLDHCIIERNNCLYTAVNAKGGGIFTNGGVLTVDHCTFYENEISIDSPYGMEIHTEGNAAMTVTNSIFLAVWDFWTIVFNSTVPASVSYDDFTSEVPGSGTQRFMGNVPPGLGVLTQVNTNGDPCDVYYNIFLDPLFENPGSGNFQITWANWPNPDYTKSPCIDAGDPEFASDRDSTITDIGRYFFDQSVPKISFSSSILDFGSVLIGEQADSVLKIYNAGLDTLVINQLFNDEAVFSTDYNPADNMILPGDSISITVTFTPVGTVPVIDTIHIYNNDQDSIVKLTGTGQSPTGIFDLSGVITKKYLLRPPYPNPASSYTTFEIDLPRQSFIILTIHNMSGEEINTIISKELAAGRYKYVWNTGNLANGTYLLKLQAGEYKEVRKIVILR
jgi:parallel beta-helix repeat protein